MPAIATASLSRRLLQGLVLGLLAFAASAALWRWVQPVENKTWDMRARLFAKRSPATDSICLIFLDQDSLDWAAKKGLGWPWYRDNYSPILNFCQRAGAQSVVFDVLLTEYSAYGVEDDAMLASAIRNNGRFIQAFFPSGASSNWPAGYRSPFPPGIPDPALLPAGTASGSVTWPIPEIATNAALLAHARAAPDKDGIIRRTSLFTVFDGRLAPSLGLAPVLLDAPGEPRIEKRALRLGRYRIPFDAQGLTLLRYRGPSQTHTAFSAASIIDSELLLQEGKTPTVDPALLKGKHVFFGFTAHGLFDLRPTPTADKYPGVEIHATALDNLLAGDFMADVPRPAALAVTLLLCVLAGASIRASRSARAGAILLIVFLAIPFILAWGLYPAGWWMPLVAPEAGVALAVIAGLVTNYAAEGSQRRFIKNAFSQYLSPVVIDQLVQNPERLTLGGEKKPLSILFSDLRGFTGISETLDPQALTALLNQYLTAVTSIIYEEGGTIDKYEGDAVIAFWNAPLDMPDHALRAVRAAVRYQEKLAELRPVLRNQFGHDLFARIGLNTGPVVIGNMGSAQRFNYTFLGDAGNLAARLEGINKQFGTPILVSQFTRDQAGNDFAFRPIARVGVVGRREPVNVYEPMTHDRWRAGEALFAAFAAAYARFEKGDFAEAAAGFQALAETDPVSASYAKKCESLIASPPGRWDGVWTMTEK